MPTYIALLRAVNVGGRFYKMADLRKHLSESGLQDVETHIQSGNVRFRSTMRTADKVEQHVETVLGEHCGFDVPSIILTPAELRSAHRDALAMTPPDGADDAQVRRYVSFFKAGDVPSGDVARQIEEWHEPGERAAVLGRAVHIWIAGPMHDAPFFKTFKKALAPGTNRDLKVVAALDDKWGG
jgi:uncharacterized protein (DUF1697 family)